MNELFILSHKNPDTDSIVSSIVAEKYFIKVSGVNAKAYRIGDINNETKFVLEQFNIEAPVSLSLLPENAKVALVDHNSPEEAINGLKSMQVEKIIDHHKITIQNDKPIFARFEPLGSTSTIIAKIYSETNIAIPAEIARLLLAGILSDTLNLTGPTATDEDKKILKNLNKIAKINTNDFSQKMFEAKSDISMLTPKDIIEKDSKFFQMGNKKVCISGWETLKMDSILKIKSQIISELKNKKMIESLDYAFFLAVDILKKDGIMFIIGESEKSLAEKIFGVKAENNEIFLKGVVSRKKQVVPPLMAELLK